MARASWTHSFLLSSLKSSTNLLLSITTVAPGASIACRGEQDGPAGAGDQLESHQDEPSACPGRAAFAPERAAERGAEPTFVSSFSSPPSWLFKYTTSNRPANFDFFAQSRGELIDIFLPII